MATASMVEREMQAAIFIWLMTAFDAVLAAVVVTHAIVVAILLPRRSQVSDPGGSWHALTTAYISAASGMRPCLLILVTILITAGGSMALSE